LQGSAELLATTPTAFDRALVLAVEQHLQVWDALILAVAEEAGCETLLSEDLQDGFRWRRLTVVNPFLHRLPA
ncbi:hypothetical protein J8J07_22440, partial [Mycobacterium tuberculosis]|nr:hypothetical protein [Mycobacterium tuberculosis]